MTVIKYDILEFFSIYIYILNEKQKKMLRELITNLPLIEMLCG